MDEMFEKFGARLSSNLGDDTVVEEDAKLGLNGIAFYNESPNPDFNGFGGEQMLEVNLILDEKDDDKVRSIERVSDAVIFTKFAAEDFNRSALNAGVYFAEGMALICARDSEDERKFLEMALAEIMDEAAEPLHTVIQFARAANIRLPESKAALASLLTES